MKRILAWLTGMLAASVASAAGLTAADQQWLAANKVVMTQGMAPNQLTGLHYMINHDCPAGKFKAGGVELDCKGNRVADVNEYLNIVAIANFMNDSPKETYTGPALMAHPEEALSPEAHAWVQANKVVLPFMTPEEAKGLDGLVGTGCKPGDVTVAGIAFKCTGRLGDDVNAYLNDISMLHFMQTK